MWASSAAANSSNPTPVQSRPSRKSHLSVPKSPSARALSGPCPCATSTGSRGGARRPPSISTPCTPRRRRCGRPGASPRSAPRCARGPRASRTSARRRGASRPSSTPATRRSSGSPTKGGPCGRPGGTPSRRIGRACRACRRRSRACRPRARGGLFSGRPDIPPRSCYRSPYSPSAPPCGTSDMMPRTIFFKTTSGRAPPSPASLRHETGAPSPRPARRRLRSRGRRPCRSSRTTHSLALSSVLGSGLASRPPLVEVGALGYRRRLGHVPEPHERVRRPRRLTGPVLLCAAQSAGAWCFSDVQHR